MTEGVRPVLVDYLTKHYASLKLRVTRLLGNGDLAGDALQDTWMRLNSKEEDGPVHSPGSYLVRMAVNIAVDMQRRQGRSLPFDEVNALMELSDPTPGPVQTSEARSELAAVVELLRHMPQRRREIIVLVRWDGLTQQEVARRLGVSLRTVEYEIKRAHDYLDTKMRNGKN